MPNFCLFSALSLAFIFTFFLFLPNVDYLEMLAWIKLMCLERFSKPSPNTVLAIRNKHPQSSTIDYMSVYELVTPRCSPLLCWLISSPVSCTTALLHCCTTALLHYCTPPCYMSCYFAWISKCVFKIQIYIALVGW